MPRPPFQLRSLPVRYRWEVNRRHPYYQIFWAKAQAYYNRKDDTHPLEYLLNSSAVLFLNAIGVSGAAPDPATEFAELGADQINDAWASGAVHPITFRGLVGSLIAVLPKETLAEIGSLLVLASQDEAEDEPPPIIMALLALQTSGAPGLDTFPAEPIVTVNPAASARQVNEAVNSLLKEWKEERELTDQRSRTDKYGEYLRVWDLREGWSGGTYDPSAELTLKEVAQQLRMPIATISHHYQNAFELVIGHPYSPELWTRLMGPLKLSTLMTPVVGRASRTRPTVTPTRRPVPESVLLGPTAEDGAHGPVSGTAEGGVDADIVGMVERIRELIASGFADSQIADELGLSSAAVAAIEYIRRRGGDIYQKSE